MSSFSDIFAVNSGIEPAGEPEIVQHEWFGPPEDELGACVPTAVAVGRSDRAVVALRCATAYSTGVMLDLVAVARGLRESEANRVFHEQHAADVGEEPSDFFLRVGIEYQDCARVSNLGGRRRLWGADQAPDGPILLPQGGGGGHAGGGRVTMSSGFWLWPLPPRTPWDIVVEWPAFDLMRSRATLDGEALVDAAARSLPLWDVAPGGGDPTRA